MDVNRVRTTKCEQVFEKIKSLASAAKAAEEIEALIAALKVLRHPKTDFLRSLFERAKLAIRMVSCSPPECIEV